MPKKHTRCISRFTSFIAFILALASFSTNAANVVFDLVIDESTTSFSIFASASLNDNSGIAGFDIQLFDFDSVTIIAPSSTITSSGHNWGFSLTSEVLPDPDPSYIYAIQDFTYLSGDSLLIDPDQVFYNYGQSGGLLTTPYLTSDETWYKPALLLVGTYSQNQPSFGYTDANVWNDESSLTSFQATITTSVRDKVLGDYNQDGTVDQADYTIWADSYGDTGDYMLADGNNDNIIDQGDYTIWADHYGDGAPPASPPLTIPEPATCLLLTLGIITCFSRRRTSSHSMH